MSPVQERDPLTGLTQDELEEAQEAANREAEKNEHEGRVRDDFGIFVNGVEVWSSGSDAVQVSEVEVSTVNGAFGALRVSDELNRLDIKVSVGTLLDSNNPLNLRDRAAASAQSAEVEEASKQLVEEDRAAMREAAESGLKTEGVRTGNSPGEAALNETGGSDTPVEASTTTGGETVVPASSEAHDNPAHAPILNPGGNS